MITIDGYEWPVPCDVTRVAEVKPSEISGLMLDKSYFNDVIGMFLSYEVKLAVPNSMRNEYAALYESLTDPVDAHSFAMPYNNGTIEITARVEKVQDVYIYVTSEKSYWKGITFTAIANHPTKSMELDDVISRGRSPMPEAVEVPLGALYEMTSTGWQVADLADADEGYY